MTVAAAQAASWRRVAADPTLLVTLVAVWLLLGLFVLYPLVGNTFGYWQ